MPDFGTDDGGTEELLSSMWASLIGSQVAVWAVVSVSVLFFCAFCVPKALASGHAVQLPVYKCPYPDSPDPEQYERFLTGLNGTKIVFIGDSITRCGSADAEYTGQLLTLAQAGWPIYDAMPMLRLLSIFQRIEMMLMCPAVTAVCARC